MPQPRVEPTQPAPYDPLAEHSFDDDSYAEQETTRTEEDDDPSGEDDFPVPIASDPKTD